MKQTLLDKVWQPHTVLERDGMTQLLVDTHLIHEVTSPQAFGMLRQLELTVRYPHRTFATVDHIVPTTPGDRFQPWADAQAQKMLEHLRRNCADFGIRLFDVGDPDQGIVHIIGPQLGLTQPGTVIVCGDSHTATHGAFGAVALGIGTTEVRDVLATQTLFLTKPKVRRIEVTGELGYGVYAKDLTLAIIGRLGTEAGAGFAYEYGGRAVHNLTMEERMTLCNMAIEGGARCGYVNPDNKTADFLAGRKYANWPAGRDGQLARRAEWLAYASDEGAEYDDVVKIRGEEIAPQVTWGINPGQVIGVDGRVPEDDRPETVEARDYMQLRAGQPIAGTKINVAFIGSCTNGRISDLREAAGVVRRNGLKVAAGVKAIVVPGSEQVRAEAEAEGIHEIFRAAGFEWRDAGCSMCLAMNPDKLVGDQVCASSSNRNFKGRQGSKTGRTLLMSPAMVVASAATGVVTDPRTLKLAA